MVGCVVEVCGVVYREFKLSCRYCISFNFFDILFLIYIDLELLLSKFECKEELLRRE